MMNLVIAITLTGCLLGGGGAFAGQPDSVSAAGEVVTIFHEIEHGVRNEDAGSISKYFGGQVFLSLENGDGAYYSSNHALLIIQNFFKNHHILAFRFSSINPSDSPPYATGGGTMRVKNNREILQVYISLTLTNSRWVISEFNMY